MHDPVGKPESVRRKPGLLERYVELMYRRKMRAILALFRLQRKLSAQEFKVLNTEERLSAVARSITFFALGLLAAYVIFRVLVVFGIR